MEPIETDILRRSPICRLVLLHFRFTIFASQPRFAGQFLLRNVSDLAPPASRDDFAKPQHTCLSHGKSQV